MSLTNTLISRYLRRRIERINYFELHAYEVQNWVLEKLITSAKNTEWGKVYDYQRIHNYEDFRKKVPVQDYESLKSYIERVRQGENNVLWNTPIRWFAKSSGTTNDKSKFIPLSKESLYHCHFKAGKDMLSIYVNHYPQTRLFSGKSLVMGGSQTLHRVNHHQIVEGDLSAILMQNLPFWAAKRSTPELKVALMKNWEEKIAKMAQITIKENVTSIIGVPSWTLVLLKRILEDTNRQHIGELWPRLEVFFHGGVSFRPYKQEFEKLISLQHLHYVETYNASEGFFGIQDDSSEKAMLLMLDYGIFYEFVPLDKIDQPDEYALPLWQTELGKNYAMLISTNSGLWRYMLGDTIIFTRQNPYKFRVTGRTCHFINAFGEEVIAENVERAFEIACKECNAQLSEYTGAPVYFSQTRNGAHQWLVEFEKTPEDFECFVETFDKALQSVNSDYEAKRFHDMVLSSPIIQQVPRGTFYQWMKNRNKLGGQNKVPRLANERNIIEEILEMLQQPTTKTNH